MDDILFYIVLSSSIVTILFIISLLTKRSSADTNEKVETEGARTAVAARPAPTVRRVGGSRVARRTRLNPSSPSSSQSPEEIFDNFNNSDSSDDDETEIAKPFITDQKIGAKKRKKLEMKAEKKAQREQEVNEREERIKRQAQLDEKRKKEEEEKAAEKAMQLEEEKRLQKIKEEKELEEYLKLKATFEIEGGGFEEQSVEDEKNLLNDFLNHIKNEKVVLLEDLAVQFKLKTQDVIDRINNLLETKALTGVIDDRGKFIHISKEELQAIVKFINQRGRVTISELAENSNSLIMMSHKSNEIKS